ncbi:MULTISPECIES: hypothetical protein [Cysteiniphilum]|uniref:hypothetical protein n=1 Tax=Cysteiniphilum TaxID=2056696 RepID=UPI0017869E59|nr:MULTISPECIES: hypothetical protein [Cysteiniphilum]
MIEDIVYWKDIKGKVKKLNPKLYAIIDEINPPYKILNLSYPYGDIISDEHYYYQKFEGQTAVKLPDTEHPFMLLLEGVIETFLQIGDKTITYDLYQPGDFFPYTSDIEINLEYPSKPNYIYHFHSGVRNICMLPMTALTKDYLNLSSKYNLEKSLNPSNNQDHYNILKSLINPSAIKWRCKVLAFGNEWKSEIMSNPEWHKLKEYIYQNAILANQYRKSTFYLDFVMHRVSQEYKTTNQEYVFEIIKNIMLISLGDAIGLAPVHDESLMPRKEISDKFIDGYGNRLTPIMIAPYKYNYKTDNEPVYYSLYIHNQTVNKQKTFQPISYLDKIYKTIEYYLHEFNSNVLTKSLAFGKMQGNLNLNYYAPIGNKDYLHDASKLVNNDSRFRKVYDEYNTLSLYGFPKRSNFTKALISISLDRPDTN